MMGGLVGVRVLVLENREATALVEGLRVRGAEPVLAPALQEIALHRVPEAQALGRALLAGEVDILICMTAGGARLFLELLHELADTPGVQQALSRTVVVARGPKTRAVLQAAQVVSDLTLPEWKTWQEIVVALDENEAEDSPALRDARVGVVESGTANPALVEALKARHARVVSVPMYRWALPDDTRPLTQAIEQLLRKEIHAVLFTQGVQARHLLQVAAGLGKEEELLAALRRAVVASIGPQTSDALRHAGIAVDCEPASAQWEGLLAELAASYAACRQQKSAPEPQVGYTFQDMQGQGTVAVCHRDAPFLRACRGEPTPVTPIWLMRQAGRYLAEYRQVRRRCSFKEMCQRPEVAAEVTVTAAKRLGVDAAIIFSDILVLVEPLGLGLTYAEGEGPLIRGVVRSGADVDALREIDPPASLQYVAEALRLTRAALPPNLPLIGFAAAPFTLAAYLLEGGGSKHFLKTKRFMYTDGGAWHALMQKLARGIAAHLKLQIEAGADAVQLFDSWVGCLSVEDYRRYVLPHTQAVVQALPKEVPLIHFGTGTGALLPVLREAGGSVLGLDWRVELGEAWARIGFDRAVQGNLDPAVLLADAATVEREAQHILSAAAGRPGHIFNLGHGVLPGTPVDCVLRLVDYVHTASRAAAAR